MAVSTYLSTVVFPTASLSGQCRSLELHRSLGQHDLAVLTLTPLTGGASSGHQTGVPLAFSYGTGRWPWVGYVHTSEPSRDGMNPLLEVTSLGATYTLSGSNQRSWRNATASMVVQQICHAHCLTVDVVETSRVYDQITQSGQTDWQLINRLAAENGRFVVPDGPVLRFLDRTSLLQGHDPANPIPLTYRPNRSTDIFSYRILSSDDPGQGTRHASHSHAGVDPRTVQVVQFVGDDDATLGTATGSRPFFQANSATPVNSTLEAAHRQEAAGVASSWRYRLQLCARGGGELAPGAMVVVNGLGEYDALWLVESAAHVINANGHRVELQLVADSLGEPTVLFRNTRRQLVPQGSAVLRNSAPPGADPSQAFAAGLVRWTARTALPEIPKPSGASTRAALGSIARRATRAAH